MARPKKAKPEDETIGAMSPPAAAQPAVDRAFDEGKRAGMKGEPNMPPYDPSVPQHGSWLNGFSEGNAVLASEGFKRLTPVEQAAA